MKLFLVTINGIVENVKNTEILRRSLNCTKSPRS